jgi:lipoprotein NlpI
VYWIARYEAAENTFKAVLDLDPTNKLALKNLGAFSFACTFARLLLYRDAS